MNVILYDPEYISYSIDSFRKYLVPELASRLDNLIWVAPKSRHLEFRTWLPRGHNVELMDLVPSAKHPIRWLSAFTSRILFFFRLNNTYFANSIKYWFRSVDIAVIAKSKKINIIFCLAFVNQSVPRGRFYTCGILCDLSPDLPKSYLDNIDRWINSAFCTFCISKYTLAQLTARNKTNKCGNTHVVWLSPRSALTQSSASRDMPNNSIHSLPHKNSTIKLFMPAALDKRKGHIVLLESCIVALSKGIQISIAFVGFGTDFLNSDRATCASHESSLLAYARKFKDMGGHLNALGHVTDINFSILLDSSDVVVFPSLYEGFGLPVSEAVMAGLPVIASDLPPIREQLDLYDCHDRVLLVPPGDPHALALALINYSQGEGPPRVPPGDLVAKFKKWTWANVADSMINHLAHDYTLASGIPWSGGTQGDQPRRSRG